MKTRALVLVLALGATPVVADVGMGTTDIGDRCNAGDPAPRPGLICRPSFQTVSGQLREEWEYDTGHVLNGRRGDAVLSPGCGLVANLLKQVHPTQMYSHAGIMVEDRYKIRHSTASEERVFAYVAGDPPGTQGVLEHALKYPWPGTITQWADEAFEGSVLTDPQSGVGYTLQSFNPHAVNCGDNGELIPDTVLKPPPLVDADPKTGARARLESAAAAAQDIQGHYRFFGYTDPQEILYTPVDTNNWADGTVGTVCSAMVWRAMKDAGITLEGDTIEPQDTGAQVDPETPDGMYLYTQDERNDAAEFLYDKIYNMIDWRAGPLGDLFLDASDDIGNQVVNCFGFDWCGETFSTYAAQAGCDPDDGRAQDSPCWLNEGAGVGRAVSPDNMLWWDAAPDGPYGYREDLHYAPGGYYRVYRWGPDAGTATLRGTVTDGGNPAEHTIVHVEGLYAMDTVDASGEYQIDAIPAGPWTVRACSMTGRGDAAIVDMPSSGTLFQSLTLEPGCDADADPGKWRRQVRIHGTVKIVDTEDFGDDEIDTWTLDETVVVEPDREFEPGLSQATVTWERCTGNEVIGRLRFKVDLDQHDRSVDVALTSIMLEGESCGTDDIDDTTNKFLRVGADSSSSVAYDMESEEWQGEDTMHINLTLENVIAPQD